jgi:hypothetical protein
MGAHEPPTNRSFYFSLAASTIRFAIIVALVIGGVVVIDQAFVAPPSAAGGGGGGDGGAVGPTGGPTESPSPSPATTGPTGTTAAQPSPQIEGVRIAVFNGSGVTGLAGDTMLTLEDQYGYVQAQAPADAPAPYAVTTIYYRGAENKVEAEFLASDFFAPLEVEIKKLQPGTADIKQDVQLAIFLGSDYAAQAA